MAWMEDTLISGNSLTGISVVRSGVLNLSGSDITGNGHEHGKEQQIMIEDLHGVRDQVRQNGIVNIRGDLMEGPLANNYVSRKSCKISVSPYCQLRTSQQLARKSSIAPFPEVSVTSKEFPIDSL